MTVYSLNSLPEHIKETPFYKERLNEVDDEYLDALDYNDKDIPIHYLDFEDPKFLSRALRIITYWQIEDYPLIVYQYFDEYRDNYLELQTFLEKKLKENTGETNVYEHFLKFLHIDHDYILRFGCCVGSYHAIEHGLSFGNKLENKSLQYLCEGGFLSCLKLIFSKIDKKKISFLSGTKGAAIGGQLEIMKYLFDEYKDLSTEDKENNPLFITLTSADAIKATSTVDPKCKVIKFLVENGCPSHSIEFIESGSLDCIKYALSKNLIKKETSMLPLCGRARKDLIEIFYNTGFNFAPECYAMVVYGRKQKTTYECIEYLLEIGCPIDTEEITDLDTIISFDDAKTLRLLMENNFGIELTIFESIQCIDSKAIKCFEYIMSSKYWLNGSISIDDNLYSHVELDNNLEYAKIMLKYNYPREDFKLTYGDFNETSKLLFEYGFPVKKPQSKPKKKSVKSSSDN